MAWKILLKFNTSQGGFSEVWATNDSTNPDGLNTGKVRQLALLRLALCGKDAILVGARVSLYATTPRPTWNVQLGTPPLLLNTIVANNTTYGGTYGANATPDQLQTCVQMQFYDASGHRKAMYMAGIPDDVIVTDPNGPTVTIDPQWGTNFNAWLQFLQNNSFGWIGKAYTGAYAPASVIAWVAAPAPALGLWAVVTGALPAGVFQGAKVQVLSTQMSNRALAKPNGTYTVTGTGAYTPTPGANYVWFSQLQNIDPTQIVGLGRVQAVAKLGVFYQLVSGFIFRQGSHKRGRFFGQYRGKVSKPARI